MSRALTPTRDKQITLDHYMPKRKARKGRSSPLEGRLELAYLPFEGDVVAELNKLSLRVYEPKGVLGSIDPSVRFEYLAKMLPSLAQAVGSPLTVFSDGTLGVVEESGGSQELEEQGFKPRGETRQLNLRKDSPLEKNISFRFLIYSAIYLKIYPEVVKKGWELEGSLNRFIVRKQEEKVKLKTEKGGDIAELSVYLSRVLGYSLFSLGSYVGLALWYKLDIASSSDMESVLLQEIKKGGASIVEFARIVPRVKLRESPYYTFYIADGDILLGREVPDQEKDFIKKFVSAEIDLEKYGNRLHLGCRPLSSRLRSEAKKRRMDVIHLPANMLKPVIDLEAAKFMQLLPSKRSGKGVSYLPSFSQYVLEKARAPPEERFRECKKLLEILSGRELNFGNVKLKLSNYFLSLGEEGEEL